MDPLTILAAFGPLLVDGGKALIQKYFAPAEFKPTKIEDYAAMRRLDLELFQAMNAAGGTNPSYLWVEAVVRLQRPFVVAVAMATWASFYLSGMEMPDAVVNFAGAIGFYLFGDRSLFYARKAVAGGAGK